MKRYEIKFILVKDYEVATYSIKAKSKKEARNKWYDLLDKSNKQFAYIDKYFITKEDVI